MSVTITMAKETRKTAWDCGYAFYGRALRDIVSYSKAYADRRGLLYELNIKEYLRKMKMVISLIREKLKRDSLVLEVGCGGGYYLDFIHEHYGNTSLVAVDISMRAIKERKMNGIKFGNVEFVEADTTQLPFRDGVFDCVYSSETLEHIPRIEKFFDDAFRIIKGEGLMAALTPNGTQINPFAFLVLPILMFKKMKKKSSMMKSNSKEHLAPYDKALSATELEHLSLSKGFHNVTVKSFFHFPPHSCFPKEFKLSKPIYNLFLLMDPILKILLRPYGRFLILNSEKPKIS